MISCSIRIPKLTGGQTTTQVKFILSLMIVIWQKRSCLIWFWINIANLEISNSFNSFHPKPARHVVNNLTSSSSWTLPLLPPAMPPHFTVRLETRWRCWWYPRPCHPWKNRCSIGSRRQRLLKPFRKCLVTMTRRLAEMKRLDFGDFFWWYQMGDRYSRSFIDSLDCPSTVWQEFQHCLAVEYVSNFEYLSMPGCLSHQKTTTHFFYRNWFSNSGNASIVCFNQGFRSTFEDGPTTPMASLHQHDEAYTCLACPLSWWLQPPLRGWTAVGGWYGFLVVCHPWLQCTRTQCCSY